ncbi:MAG: dihydroorotate dehydrogenase electron transfer subunit [Firmicutes bacterium]|nr:dihydroorotate dehydrogenase electron transfer subunit [Bacillota bacterium]
MKDLMFKVIKNKMVSSDVFAMQLQSNEPLPPIKAGQFLNLQVPDKSLILRRPFCIYDACCDTNTVTIYAAVVGKGTAALSTTPIGQSLLATLPLGNGFDFSNYKNIGLLGGGMGCAALHLLAKFASKNASVFAYFGFANKDRVLFDDDFKKVTTKLDIYTNDGSVGIKGFPITGLKQDLDKLDAVFICGAFGMVKNAAEELKNSSIPIFVSLEQRMACGVGACLVCTCPILCTDTNTAKNKRVCFDGPVFKLNDVLL